MKMHKAYIKAKRLFLAGKQCAVFPDQKATEVHHVFGRLGPLLSDQTGWLAVSSAGHRFIHANPNHARAQKWLAPLGRWNCTPRTKHLRRE